MFNPGGYSGFIAHRIFRPAQFLLFFCFIVLKDTHAYRLRFVLLQKIPKDSFIDALIYIQYRNPV